MKNIKILGTDLHTITKFTKEFISFQKFIKKPLLVGFFLTALLTATRLFHNSFCDSLNSMFSPNLLIFTSYIAIFFHILSPWCKISKKFSESIYEVAAQVTFFLISGIVAALAVMNFQESAVTWYYLLKLIAFFIPFLYVIFSLLTTLPYFLLINRPATGKDVKQKLIHPSMLYVCFAFAVLTLFYIIEPNGFEEFDFCENIAYENQ